MRFKNKVVLVTGATQNTGLEIAALFIQEGAKVIVNGHNDAALKSGEKRLKEKQLTGFSLIAADISNEREVVEMFDQIKKEYGRLDVLVNNACHQGIGYGFDASPDQFFEVIRVNLFGTFLVSQQAVKIMEQQDSGGVIVNLGSNVSTRAIHERTAYVASKGGIDALTRSMATDLGPKGIRVNLVAPGYINTQRWETLAEEVKQRRRKNVPSGEEASGEDVARVVLFLASEDSKAMHGARLLVDGGSSAQHLPVDIDI
tara:strand:- start:35220 stop:35993 length:774 start_codon:yes stop_codon:yes gene_type:complete